MTTTPATSITVDRARQRGSMVERWRHLPREARDTIFLLLVIGWTLLPHATHLPWWAIGLTSAVLIWRGRLAWRGRPLPSTLVRGAVLMLAVGLTWWTHRTIFGKEPGVTLLVMLTVIKALELRARRDALVMFFLGFFIVVTNFFFSQSIPVALAMLLSVWGLLTALVLAHMPSGRPSLWRAGRIAARAAALGLPIMVVLFLLFPRIGPLWGSPDDTSAKTGLSGSLRMGGIIELISDDRIAMRVRFEGAAPPPSQLYFRGPVLTRFDGREWTRARTPEFDQRAPTKLSSRIEPAYRYEMVLEPSHLPMLPMLEGTLDEDSMRPTTPVMGTDRLAILLPSLRDDLQWVTERPVAERLNLRAAAVANLRQGPFESDSSFDEYLRLPDGFNPRTNAWAVALLTIRPELRQQGALAIVEAVNQHINANYSYTLTPGTFGDETGRHAIDEFWLDRRAGFCEHFATAMVFILRSVGVPARIVTGYQGSDPVPQDGWLIVRQLHAHAWVEAWAPGQGWMRIDPTAAVAPERVQSSATLRPSPGLMAGALANLDPSLLPALRRTYERLEHSWNQWVVQYSRGQQYELLKRIGVEHPDWESAIRLMASASDCVTVCGVPAGAATMIHDEASYPGTPPSLMVGSSGRSGDRTAVLMPSARTRPSRMTGRNDIRLSITSWIRPVIRSVSDSVVAL